MPRLLLLLLVVAAAAAPAQHATGRVADAANGSPLPAATIRVDGTDRGTIANADGVFRLGLEPGRYRLSVSFIGYRPSVVDLDVPQQKDLVILLEPSPIALPEVVVSGEDPAVAIMRAVIDRKRRWAELLRTYSLKAFTRQVIRVDTSIRSIIESYTDGYWKAGDTLREVVVQKRKTENVAQDRNVATVGRIVNFYDDDVRILGTDFVGPTSPDAFDAYAFRLERTIRNGEQQVFVISLNPRSRVTPQFRGTISVVDERFAIVGVDVEPNEALRFPFARRFDLSYRQQFGLVQERYWLPVDIRIAAEFEFGVAFVSIPPITFEQVSAIYDYGVNVPVPDSLFGGQRVRHDSAAATFDSTFWAQNEVLPLSSEQQEAYATLDSTQTFSRSIVIRSPIGNMSDSGTAWLGYVDGRFDRATGAFAGFDWTDDSLAGPWGASLRAGYGFASRKADAAVGISRRLGDRWTVRLEAASGVRTMFDLGYHDRFVNSVNALLLKNDYFDYYRADGISLESVYRSEQLGPMSVRLRAEEHRPLSGVTNTSIVDPRRPFRPNPPAVRGTMRSLEFGLHSPPPPMPFLLMPGDRYDARVEAADDAFGSDFSYVRAHVSASYRTSTFNRRLFLGPYAMVHVHAGVSAGDLPTQRQFRPETQSARQASPGVLRGARIAEFGGDRYALLSVEHNFRNTLFLMTGIPWLYDAGLETVFYATGAHVSRRPGSTGPGSPTRGVYVESGLGLSKVFDIIRIDATYRFAAPSGWHLSLGIAQVF